jgi:hypothetical protein
MDFDRASSQLSTIASLSACSLAVDVLTLAGRSRRGYRPHSVIGNKGDDNGGQLHQRLESINVITTVYQCSHVDPQHKNVVCDSVRCRLIVP